MKNSLHYIALLLTICCLTGCTEQYALQSTDFESALVVEATLTNELKFHEVKLSRTFRLEEDGPQFEADASVSILASDGAVYDFVEANGIYRSVDAFRAEPDKTYRLRIATSDGKIYSSRAETLTTPTQLEDVVASVGTVNDVLGITINAKSFDPANTSKYYRYTFAETYKIIAPYWTPFKAIRVPTGGEFDGIDIVPRTNGESKTCFKTVFSTDIIQTSTNELLEDRVDFTVRFIAKNDPIITHRYSILVTQYVQSHAAYMFYKTLKELSGQGSILSQNQPGFFYGNLRNEAQPAEKVIGFFEVASASSQRIYFNYTDLFPGEQLPPYFVDCSPNSFKFCFIPTDFECRGAALLSMISTNQLLYFADEGLYYFMVPPSCGDCNYIGSNIVPSFWQD